MDKFNNQFATQKLRKEMSVTGGTANYTQGPGEQVPQVATKKVSKKKTKKEVKDVEPKYAAGKAKIYAKEKWGWKEAPSVPNRPSKGGFIYKQLFEELSDFVNEIDRNDPVLDRPIYKDWDEFVNPHYIIVHLNNGNKLKISRNRVKGGDAVYHAILKAFNDDNYKITNKVVSAMLNNLEEIQNLIEPEEQDDDEDRYDWFTDKYEPVSDYSRYRQDPDSYEKDYQEKGTSDYFQRRGLDENYSRFKNETKTRGKSDQFHQAVRQVKKKVQEINRLFEYVSRLKMELSEGEDGLKYKVHTEKALEKIKEMVSALNQNVKKFK